MNDDDQMNVAAGAAMADGGAGAVEDAGATSPGDSAPGPASSSATQTGGAGIGVPAASDPSDDLTENEAESGPVGLTLSTTADEIPAEADGPDRASAPALDATPVASGAAPAEPEPAPVEATNRDAYGSDAAAAEQLQVFFDATESAAIPVADAGGDVPDPAWEGMRHLGGHLYELNGAGTIQIQATSFAGEAGYNNSTGFYFAEADGTPISGAVMWDNVKELGDRSFNITPDQIPEGADKFGFFIIPNGDRKMRELEDGDEITFEPREKGGWEAVDGSGQSHVTYFSDPTQNPEYEHRNAIAGDADDQLGVHVVDDPNLVGNMNWEDLNQFSFEGYGDYDDVNLEVAISAGQIDEYEVPAPESFLIAVEDDPADGLSGNVYHIALAEGGEAVTISFSLTVDAPQARPVELMLLQDTSGSFEDDIGTLKDLGARLPEELKDAFGENTGLGFGVFEEKPGFGGDDASDVYETVLGVTTDSQAFVDVIEDISTLDMGGRELGEASADALFQVAKRAEGEVGFGENSDRFVIIATDEPIRIDAPSPELQSLYEDHFVPSEDHAYDVIYDYYYGPAYGNGPTLPSNNGDDVVDVYENTGWNASLFPNHAEAAPTMDMLRDALNDAGIVPIFAVQGDEYTPIFDQVVEELGFGSVVPLSDGGGDIVGAIEAGVREAKADVSATITDGSPYLVSAGFTEPVTADLTPGTTLTYEATFRADVIGPAEDQMVVNIPGYGQATVNLTAVSGAAGQTAIQGEAGSDLLRGGTEGDVLAGAEGDDLLFGFGGDDLLFGNEGADTFQFDDSPGDATIADFTYEDMLDLRAVTGVADRDDLAAVSQTTDEGLMLNFENGSLLLLDVASVDEVDALF